jgi:hypothetical protein
LEAIGHGAFGKSDMKYSAVKSISENSGDQLKKYISQDCTLLEILKNISEEIKPRLGEDDFKVMLVKESLPILVLGVLDYLNFHFDDTDERTALERVLFHLLSLLCNDNNFCKAQIFKGDGLRHLKCLIGS